MKRHPFAALTSLYVVFLMLAGCAALGVPTAESFPEKAAAATVSVNTGSQTVLTLLQSRKITPDENDKYTKALGDFQEGIDFIRGVNKTNPADAENRLAALIASLNLLLAELEARK